MKVNGTAQTVTDKAVDITVPTAVSGLTNDSKFQTEDQVAATVNSKIASVYKPGGTIATLSADLLVADNEGKVYNLSAEFTTDENFVDTTGKTYPAGTNVGIINTDDGYKFDVMAGFVDLSAYETAAQTESKLEGKVSKVEGKDLSSNDFTDALKAKLEGVPEVATTAEVTEMLNEVFGTPAA